MISKTSPKTNLPPSNLFGAGGKRREGKPGVSKPGVVSLFFGKGPECVANPFGNVPCGGSSRPRRSFFVGGGGGISDNIGKIEET